MIEKHRRKKPSKRDRSRKPKQLDAEDLEIIKENAGIEIEQKKKNRLKKNADLEAEKVATIEGAVKQEKVEFDAEEMQIDTTSRPAVKQASARVKTDHYRMEVEKKE